MMAGHGVRSLGTLCGELADRLGRPFAVLVGISLFLVIASFQVSNNLAVIASIEPFLSTAEPRPEAADSADSTNTSSDSMDGTNGQS